MSAKKLKIPNFRPKYCHFNWLLKLVLKLKTIFVLWVLVSTFPKPFRVTFNRWKNEMLDTFYIAFKYTIAIKGKVNLNFEQVISTKQFRFNFIYSYMSQRSCPENLPQPDWLPFLFFLHRLDFHFSFTKESLKLSEFPPQLCIFENQYQWRSEFREKHPSTR